VARKIRRELDLYGSADQPVGVDVIEMPVPAALQDAGIRVVDGQQVFMEARRIKTPAEISLMTQACSMVDAAYDALYEFLRPGVRENECAGLVSKALYDLGSEFVEGVNAISGERCAPHPHVYSDRIIRPGDPAFFDILHSYVGYRTCYYRTFAVGSASPAQRDAYTRCRENMDEAIALVRPGATTGDIVSVWPTVQEFGFPDEEAAFALQYRQGQELRGASFLTSRT
jgi:Xaa-Pro aminopeptidase